MLHFKSYVLTFVLAITLKYSIGNNGCVVYMHPQNMVILRNSTAEITCRVDTQDSNPVHAIFNGSILSLTADEVEFEQRGITWVVFDTGLNVSILGSVENNGTTVFCGFGNCKTDEATVIVVDGPPGPQDSPDITIVNSTTFNITWHPAWPHLILGYTVTIVNENTQTEFNISIASDSTHLLFHKMEAAECTMFSFRISTQTSVGSSPLSEATYMRFPKDVGLIDKDDISISLNRTMCGISSSHYTVTGGIPNVCENETLIYDFEVIDTTTNSSFEATTKDDGYPRAVFWATGTEDFSVFMIKQTATNLAGETIVVQALINTTDVISTLHDTVEQNPRTTVALVNTNATFTCFDNDTGSFPVRLEVDKKVLSSVNESERQRYQMMGITWETIEDSGNKKIGFTITINATLQNNGRQIVCYFDPCISSKAELIVVDAPPNPPLAPVVTPQNYTSLLITWHPPWDHPVNMYTIYVRIDETNEIIDFTTTELSYYLTQDLYNFTTCDALYISIEASTDVGMSGQSNESLYGFIKGVQEINVSNISSSYSFIENDKLFIEILNPPKVCTYETLSYHFSVINNRNNMTINITSQQPNVTVDLNFTMMPGDTLTVLLTMSDESNTRTIMFLLAGNIDVVISASTTSYDILPQNTVSSYYTSEMSISPSPSNKEENQFLMMVIIGSSVFGVLFLLLVLITCLIVIVALFVCRRSKKDRINVNETTDQIDNSLRRMVTNENYANPQEIVYDQIMSLKDLKPLHANNSLQLVHPSPSTPMTPGSDAPLLPPRNLMNQPSPVGTPPLRERRHLQPLTLKQSLDVAENDDYIPMVANPIANGFMRPSPRYTEAPSLTFPLSSNELYSEPDGVYALPS